MIKILAILLYTVGIFAFCYGFTTICFAFLNRPLDKKRLIYTFIFFFIDFICFMICGLLERGIIVNWIIFLFIAFIQIYFLFKYAKLSGAVFPFIVFFFITCYFQDSMNVMRQFCAFMIILNSLVFIRERCFYKFLLFIYYVFYKLFFIVRS